MSFILTIIVFLIVFSVLVLVHEWGHFVMAKRAGIKVEEFGFGLPPRIWGKKKGETIYSINWIPFGGFVRLYGEDSSNPKMLKSDRSFAGKPMRARVKVVVAGVVMNFLLAWVLLVVGFTAGMQPLLVSEDVFPAISDGRILLEPGVKIKEVDSNSKAASFGLKEEDRIVVTNDQIIDEFSLGKAGNYQALRDAEIITFQADDFGDFGMAFYDVTSIPRVKIFEIPKHTVAYKAGLRPGDIILEVNNTQIFTIEDFENVVRGEDSLDYKIYREGLILEMIVQRQGVREIIISKVLPDGPAAKAGLMNGDVISAVNGREMTDSLELINFVQEHRNENLAYTIERHGQRIFYEIKPRNGRIDVLLSELMNYDVDPGMSLYNVDLLSSIVDVKEEKYHFFTAIWKGLDETWRLSKMTAVMFIDMVKQLASTGNVPESVAGPVGIARMTHAFVQEGLIPLIRFVAILSLSLAVINILPIPALDGGRLLFIVIEFIIGRRIPQKWEAYVHAFGYVLIILLILAVTYSDIMKLVS
ncbi:RIP metalloprotease RseP [Candidatus Peregrinibacteria bacterium]|nr:RIP metalloprotease RseP [Candidatus Peregrinibacteria bacterium]